MRLKTLGVLLVVVLSAVTLAYWFVDVPVREDFAQSHDEELAHLGEIVYSDDPLNPMAAGCARCHGPEGEGGPIPNDPEGRIAPSLRSASIANKLRVNENYVSLVVRYGGIVVSGNVNSPMPAWSTEVGGPLNEQQIEAVVELVEGWAMEAAEEAPEEVENTAEAGAQVFSSAGCAGCHGPNLEGTGSGPNIQPISQEVIVEFDEPFPDPSQADQMQADYAEDPRMFLELWIRDSSGNYNDGAPTLMPAHPEEQLPESHLQALITFLLEQQEGALE